MHGLRVPYAAMLEADDDGSELRWCADYEVKVGLREAVDQGSSESVQAMEAFENEWAVRQTQGTRILVRRHRLRAAGDLNLPSPPN